METGFRLLVVSNKELNRLHRVKQSKKRSNLNLLRKVHFPRYGSGPPLIREWPLSAKRMQALLGPLILLDCPHGGRAWLVVETAVLI